MTQGRNAAMRDYDYFLENLLSLYAKYGRCFLAIKNQSVIGVYETFRQAYDETLKTEEIGTFIIQECVDDPDKLVHYFQLNIVIPEQISA